MWPNSLYFSFKDREGDRGGLEPIPADIRGTAGRISQSLRHSVLDDSSSKQPSHLCVNRESWCQHNWKSPSIMQLWSPSSIHHICCRLDGDGDQPVRGQARRAGPGKCATSSCSNMTCEPSLALIVTNVLWTKPFSYVNLIHCSTMQYVLTLSNYYPWLMLSLDVSLFSFEAFSPLKEE